MRNRAIRQYLGVGAVLVLVGISIPACGGGPSATRSTTTTTTTTATSTTPTTATPRQVTISLYLLRGDKLGVSHRLISATPAGGTAALRALLAGPNATENAANLHSDIPTGTRLLGLSIAGGVATVDFDSTYGSGGGSLSMTARLAQVVYTLTQFPTVTTVRFEIDGQLVTVFGSEGILINHPMSRLDATIIGVVPYILLETPAVGDNVHSPLHVTGMSNTYEATYNVQLLDATRAVVVNSFGTATAGTGTWGTFDASFSYVTSTSGTGTLRVFETSAKDGSHVNEVDLALPVGP